MNILIDSTQVPLGRTGVGLYAERLIQHLAVRLKPEDKLNILVQSDDAFIRKLTATNKQLSSIVIPSLLFRNRLALLFYEQCILPWILLFYRIDLVHSLHYTFPLLSPCPRVVTIHDLTHSIWPEMHTFGRRVVMVFFCRRALRDAEAVLFDSYSTESDAQRLYGPGNNIRAVAPLAVDVPQFSNIHPNIIAEMLARLDIQMSYILFLGTLEPRKNVVRLVQAFDSMSSQYPDLQLVIAGKLGWHYAPALEAIENSPHKSNIRRLGYVAPEDKAPLIAGCSLLVYPSLYEGFGLPVLEGMAAGVPVITSNISSLPEVAGDAALLIDPTSVEQIRAAMLSLLSDENSRDRLRKAGKEQALKFRWETTAERTYEAYAEVANNLEH